MRIGVRAGVAGLLVAVGLVSLDELAGQLLLGDPVTPQPRPSSSGETGDGQ